MNLTVFWIIGGVISFPLLVPALRDIFRKSMPKIEQSVQDEVIPDLDKWARRFGRKDAVEIAGGKEQLCAMLEKQLNRSVLLVALLLASMWFISLPLVLLIRKVDP